MPQYANCTASISVSQKDSGLQLYTENYICTTCPPLSWPHTLHSSNHFTPDCACTDRHRLEKKKHLLGKDHSTKHSADRVLWHLSIHKILQDRNLQTWHARRAFAETLNVFLRYNSLRGNSSLPSVATLLVYLLSGCSLSSSSDSVLVALQTALSSTSTYRAAWLYNTTISWVCTIISPWDNQYMASLSYEKYSA